MGKQWRVSVAIPQDPIIEWYDIEEGEDWDGRPVADKWDAGDLAYDRAVEDYPHASGVEVTSSEEIE